MGAFAWDMGEPGNFIRRKGGACLVGREFGALPHSFSTNFLKREDGEGERRGKRGTFWTVAGRGWGGTSLNKQTKKRGRRTHEQKLHKLGVVEGAEQE